MQINEYQKLAMRTSPCNEQDSGAMLNHAIFGLTSEAGEVAGIFQKVYQGRAMLILSISRKSWAIAAG